MLTRSRATPEVARTQPRRDLRHVLVVEDDSPIRAVLADLLEDAGYRVVEAIDGFEALEHLREQRPDLIVLDLMLPGLSGWQFLERSRAQLEQANVPVVVLSAIEGRGDYPASLGVAAWFRKPLDVPAFLGAVEQLIGSTPAGPPAEPRRQPAGRPRVLIVEDEPIIGGLIAERLAEDGYAPVLAGDIDQAQAHIAQAPPALILLDLMLPGRDGWTFLGERQADARLQHIPVLVISAASQGRLFEARELGADGFLSKPFDLDVLSALVRSSISIA